MNRHYKFYHNLLRVLGTQRSNAVNGANDLHVSFEDLEKRLGLSKDQIMSRTAILFEEKEIDYYNVSGIEGLFAKGKGEAAYLDSKYTKAYNQAILNRIKD